MFCGHEYTLKSLEFCEIVEPENRAVKEAIEKAKKALKDGFFTVPSKLVDEAKLNVFMRCRVPELQHSIGIEDPVALMHHLREWKNSGKGAMFQWM